jgi:hypothetical protein
MARNPLDDGANRIGAPKDKHERRAFWIAHGNAHLDSIERHDLQWVWADGFYFIEPRS